MTLIESFLSESLICKYSILFLPTMSFWDHFLPLGVKHFWYTFYEIVQERTHTYNLWRRERFRRKLENWCFWTVVLEKTLKSPLDCKEIQPVHSKGDQSWVFIGRTDAEAETPILWPPHAKSWLVGKDPDAGRDWGQEEKGTTEDEMAGWHHRLGGHEFEWSLGVGDGQGGLACCNSQGHKESDTTEQLNGTELNWNGVFHLRFILFETLWVPWTWVIISSPF